MYKLRDYQSRAVKAGVEFFQRKDRKNGLVVVPTGGGKSLIIADIAYRLDAPVLVFQPSKEILEQNYGKMKGYGVEEVGVFSASMGRKEVSKITFATIGSVKNNTEYFRRFRYAIIDECHYVNAEGGMYREFIDTIQCKVLGLTATPYRLYSSRELGSMLKFLTRTRTRVFHEVVYAIQVKELLQRGYLAKMKYYPIKAVDPGKLRTNSTGADWTDRSVKEHYREIRFNEILENVVHRLLVAGRKNILVFTRFTEEAEYLAGQLGSDVAATVSSETPKVERERVLEDFKAGRVKVVANVGILTTGFDFPGLETVVLARPTMSLALYYQMCGRAIRPFEGKESWVVDLGGNYGRFGKVEDLEMKETKPGLWAVFNGGKQLTNVFYGK